MKGTVKFRVMGDGTQLMAEELDKIKDAHAFLKDAHAFLSESHQSHSQEIEALKKQYADTVAAITEMVIVEPIIEPTLWQKIKGWFK